ncbi:putative FAD-linked oxidoreductase [Roseovarius albus]|uniref:Putative FAD-linked oxidoreductase n=1 Tax=Roseovarius albus TaxID=1247867 RepID=A0A1X6ZSV9_9RHOB|nr:FAD-binding protein [Roseovarius albus]SLN58717.1 putative FAD-linked oxidoreductase [Roseovarius albus]
MSGAANFRKDAVLRPESETDLAEAIASANSPLRIEGGGTRPVGRCAGKLLTTSGIAGITLYEPGALTMVAKAGTPLAEIAAALDAENQQLAFEPMDHRPLLGTDGTPTIGGVFAANVSGPRRIQCGAARDFLLGVRFVDGQGRILSNGGRVMKNVTGYDLVKLMAGNRGTLGVLSEVSFKVLPQPEATATVMLEGLDLRDAVKAMSAALGSPFDVAGAAHVQNKTVLRVEGFVASVTYRAQALSEKLGKFGAAKTLTNAEENTSLWQSVRDVTALGTYPAVWRLSLKPGDTESLFLKLRRLHDGFLGKTILDWGGGLVWLAADREMLMDMSMQAGPNDHCEPDMGVRVGHMNLQELAQDLGGHATLIKAPEEVWPHVNAFQPEPPPLAALSDGIRQKFDPRGVLNRGLMGGM